MKILSIEPTPSPNTMKLNLDVSVEKGKTYDASNEASAPPWAKQLLAIAGVRSVFHTADFIALDRRPNADWKAILAQVREVFGEEGAGGDAGGKPSDDRAFGEARLYVQTFRGIPMQIRVRTELEEVRESLPERFVQAAVQAGMHSPNLIRERKLEDRGARYGELADIAKEVLAELDAAYSDERLQSLVEQAKRMAPGDEAVPLGTMMSMDEIARDMNSEDWRVRYRAFGQLKPTEASLPLIAAALRDEHVSMRRLAVVNLGELKTPEAIQLLIDALRDASAVVRRTAGDTLSDVGDPVAIGPMVEALRDKNKLVRWRAARFLYEVGDQTALAALREAVDDPEFEIALQARLAIERIETGKDAEGTIWQQMARARNQDDAER